MPRFISKKLSVILLLCACCVSSGVTALLNYAFSGPKLGPVYDFLLGFRNKQPVSGEILIIETDEIIEPDDVFTVIMALNETGASDLLAETPVLGTGAGRLESGDELSYRISDEFTVLGKNIHNLFEAIRLGMVTPQEAPEYVDKLVELSERGRDRLNAAIAREEEAGSVQAGKAAAVFGRVATAVDVRARQADLPDEALPWYSRPVPDRDMVLRRIAPVSAWGIKHIAFHALAYRWNGHLIELTEAGPVLIIRFGQEDEEIEFRFRLDKEGNILFEKPGRNSDFRRLSLDRFREYDQADKKMARLLKEAIPMGVYVHTIPEQYPHILYDYAETLKEELLNAPDPRKLAEWRTARSRFMDSLDEFLYGPSEMILVNGYEELIAYEGIAEEGIIRLQGLRDELIRTFIAMRETHRGLAEQRAGLVRETASAFCILKPSFQETGIPDSTALLANTLLSGHSITPGQSRYIVFWSLLASFAALACLHLLRPLVLLIAGLGASLLCAAGFGLGFIISAYWIDPLIPAASCLCGAVVMAAARFGIGYGRELRFRLAFGAKVNRNMLKQMIKAGRPVLGETECATAAIIAVKNTSMQGKEDGEKALEAAAEAAEFRKEFSGVFTGAGGLVLGFEGDIALACFGSPPERTAAKGSAIDPVQNALKCAAVLLNDEKYEGWHLGIECGECAFSWSEEAGYAAQGRPLVRARIFASLAKRYQVKAIIGETAKNEAGLESLKLSSLAGEGFYELPSDVTGLRKLP